MDDIESPISIFKVNLIEIISGTIVGVAMVWSFRRVLLSVEPWGWEYQPTWFIESQNEFFLSFSWFMFLLGFVASVCLIRSIRRQVNQIPFIGRISFYGYIQLTWPIILIVPPLQTLFILFSVPCLLVIIIVSLSIFAVFMINKYGFFYGNFIPILVNITLLLPLFRYAARLWEISLD